MESYRSRCECMPRCDYMTSCESMPRCERRYIGTHTTTHRLYQNCSYDIYKVCSCCGNEYDDRHYDACPMCGAPAEFASMDDSMDDPPRFGGFGRRRFGLFPFSPIFF
jgi:predicted amidophosphoribosyltransferase